MPWHFFIRIMCQDLFNGNHSWLLHDIPSEKLMQSMQNPSTHPPLNHSNSAEESRQNWKCGNAQANLEKLWSVADCNNLKMNGTQSEPTHDNIKNPSNWLSKTHSELSLSVHAKMQVWKHLHQLAAFDELQTNSNLLKINHNRLEKKQTTLKSLN